MLKLPGDEFVTIELVHDPAQGEVNFDTGLSHFVIQVESLDATLSELAARGSAPRRLYHRMVRTTFERHG